MANMPYFFRSDWPLSGTRFERARWVCHKYPRFQGHPEVAPAALCIMSGNRIYAIPQAVSKDLQSKNSAISTGP